tara:strand:- start:43877 stop:44530 length:654 start_codon:yes stop_codon:yes gene_type:complete
MNNSKKILLSTIMTAIFLSGCSEEKSVDDVISTEKEVEVTVVKTEKVEEVEEVKEVTSPKTVETVVEVKKDDNESLLKEFTTYSDMDVTANNPELQKLIDQTIQEYESFVVKIIEDFDNYKKLSLQEREENKSEIEAALKEQTSLHEENCSSIDQSNIESCNKIGESITEMKNTIAKIENSITNELKKLNAEQRNQLKKYQAKMKTNVSKLLSQDSK